MNFCQQKPRNVYKVNSFAEDIFHLDKSKKHVSFKHQGQNEESFFKRKEDWLEGCNKDGGKKLKLVYQKNDFFMERAELMFKAIAKFIMHPNIGQLCKSINQVSANFFYDLKNTIEIILANAKLGGFPENKKNILKFILQRCLTLKILDQKLCDYIKSALIRLDLDSLVACKSAFVRGSLSPHASSNAHGTIPNMEQFSGDSNFPSTKEVHDPAQRRLKLEKKIQIDGINQSCGADMSTNLVSDERRLKNYLKVPRTEIENQTIGNKMMIKRDQAENHQAKRRKRKLKYPIENKHLKSNNVTCLNLDSQGKCRSVVDHLSHAGSVAHITMPNLELPDKAHDPPLRRSKRKKIQRVNLYCGFDLSTNLVQDEKESEGNLQVSRIEMKNEKENATREMMVIRSQAKDLQVKRRKQKLMYPVENQPSKSNSVTHLDHDSQERNGDVSVRAGLPSYKSSNTYLTMPDLKQLSEGCNIPSNEKMHDPALRRSKRKKKQRVDVTAKLTSDGRQLEKNLQASLVEVKNKKQKVSKEMIKKHQAKNLQGKEITQKLNQEVTLKNISSKCQVEINMICKQEEKEWRRNLRQRQTHSDQERLESQKFKEQRKNEFRESQYYNTKENYILTKRVNDLLKVPIKIIKNDRINKNSHLIYSCSDTQCTLCNGHYARVLITDEELESVERNVKDVIPISLDGPKIFVPRIYSRLDRVTVPPNCVIDADKQFLKRYNEGLLTFMG
uniref:Uncharacterized protein n=2 Tax=Corethron hystrix TaxID=216773 RepID=A0A7S1FUK6_9STRA|mmetsp:Transcript_33248/g.76724  ORF Transcript_33248/g.76724 Transcript_33248/m.76724 type:complete len:730 (+) Transcript_33248:2698-4887(+)